MEKCGPTHANNSIETIVPATAPAIRGNDSFRCSRGRNARQGESLTLVASASAKKSGARLPRNLTRPKHLFSIYLIIKISEKALAWQGFHGPASIGVTSQYCPSVPPPRLKVNSHYSCPAPAESIHDFVHSRSISELIYMPHTSFCLNQCIR